MTSCLGTLSADGIQDFFLLLNVDERARRDSIRRLGCCAIVWEWDLWIMLVQHRGVPRHRLDPKLKGQWMMICIGCIWTSIYFHWSHMSCSLLMWEKNCFIFTLFLSDLWLFCVLSDVSCNTAWHRLFSWMDNYLYIVYRKSLGNHSRI